MYYQFAKYNMENITQHNQYNTLRSYRTSPTMAHGIDVSAKTLGITSSAFVRQAISEAIERLQKLHHSKEEIR